MQQGLTRISFSQEKESTLLILEKPTQRCQQEATEFFRATGISLPTVIFKTAPLWNGGGWNIPWVLRLHPPNHPGSQVWRAWCHSLFSSSDSQPERGRSWCPLLSTKTVSQDNWCSVQASNVHLFNTISFQNYIINTLPPTSTTETHTHTTCNLTSTSIQRKHWGPSLWTKQGAFESLWANFVDIWNRWK